MTKLYAGLDVSLETTGICVVDEDGLVRMETKVATDPDALVAVLDAWSDPFERSGFTSACATPGCRRCASRPTT